MHSWVSYRLSEEKEISSIGGDEAIRPCATSTSTEGIDWPATGLDSAGITKAQSHDSSPYPAST